MSELKPCPFCGEKVSMISIEGSTHYWCISCEVCEYDRFIFGTKDKVVNVWNARPAEDAKTREIDNLKRALQQIVEIANRRGHLTVATLQKDAWYGLAKIANEALTNAPDNNIGRMEENK